ncbi:MAG: prephenate dehydrogenase/arogenate dehydrogenase family protein [Pseudomonadota bacterium]
MTSSLTDLRARLDAVDAELLQLVAERQRIIGDIGTSKRGTGRATRDFAREKEVIEAARQRALELTLDPDLAEDLMSSLIRASLTAQEEARVAAEGRGDGRRVLIIGGAGKMGRWFVRYFQSLKFHVIVADPTPCDIADAQVTDWQSAGVDVDIIVVATELAISAKILAELAEARPAGLVFDIGSLKSPLRNALEQAAANGVQIASLHPMFGPTTRLLSGRHMIFVDAGCAPATAAAKQLFSATMVEQVDMQLDEHDRLIAYVLGLSHAANIAFFTALAESGEAAPRLRELSSTTFDAQLRVAREVAAESPSLYFEIQHLNDFGLDPLESLADATDRIRDAVKGGNVDAFARLMHNGAAYFAR